MRAVLPQVKSYFMCPSLLEYFIAT